MNPTDNALHQRLLTLMAGDRQHIVELVRTLVEAEKHGLHTSLGYSSLHVYCRDALLMDDCVAYLRISAARCARQFPAVLALLESGALTLTAVSLLRSHLKEDNANDLLERAQNKTKREVLELLADAKPKPDVTSRVRKLPQPRGPSPQAPTQAATTAPQTAGVAALHSSQPNTATTALSPPPSTDAQAPAVRPPRAKPPVKQTEPLGNDRYGVHFTASAETRAKIEEAQDLLAHRVPNGDLDAIFVFALDALLDKERKRKFAATKAPRSPVESSDTKAEPPTRGSDAPARKRSAIPAHVRRAVHERDQGRCAFVGTQGHRCESTRQLEFHHIHPVALGGQSTVANVALACRAHNLFAADCDYGKDFMQKRVAAARSANQDGSADKPGQCSNPGSPNQEEPCGAAPSNASPVLFPAQPSWTEGHSRASGEALSGKSSRAHSLVHRCAPCNAPPSPQPA